MSGSTPQLEVVVIDDVSRFACHVFQYLAETIGFGIGQIPDDGGKVSPPFRSGEPLAIPAGHARVWWVNAGRLDWPDRLADVISRVRGLKARFLVDVRGPLRPHLYEYEGKKVVELLLGAGRESDEILYVSSYRTIAEDERPIRAKTWQVLQEIAGEIVSHEPVLDGLHILVTGAGFERASRLGGCQGLGMPSTAEILAESWARSWDGPCTYEDGQGFPIPGQLLEAGDTRGLRHAASTGDLDAYWNEALKIILEGIPRDPGNGDPREQKAAASRQEYKAREDFRHSLLRYDWGQLNQALDAASLPWVAWLSTNYTGFADRALALHERDGEGPGRWSIVSTSHEAVHLSRQLLHGNLPGGKLLFKLHGHIEHLLTMAVAGQDKEIYSTLSLPVDSLHEVYSAAELYLERRLNRPESDDVFWHVVGHRMKDALLENLLLRVCANTPGLRHHFLFVRPDVAAEEHRERFSGPSVQSALSVRTDAQIYLARLRREGMPADSWADLPAWAELMAEPLPAVGRPHTPFPGAE